MTSEKTISIGREAAIELYESGWWEGLSHRQIAQKQLFISELCCPFAVFHEAVEESLGRPVFTHEFGMNYDGIVKEFLGEQGPPTFDEIISLIPEDKRILVAL